MQMLVTSTILVFFVVFRHRVRVEVIFPFPRRVRVFDWIVWRQYA